MRKNITKKYCNVIIDCVKQCESDSVFKYCTDCTYIRFGKNDQNRSSRGRDILTFRPYCKDQAPKAVNPTFPIRQLNSISRSLPLSLPLCLTPTPFNIHVLLLLCDKCVVLSAKLRPCMKWPGYGVGAGAPFTCSVAHEAKKRSTSRYKMTHMFHISFCFVQPPQEQAH